MKEEHLAGIISFRDLKKSKGLKLKKEKLEEIVENQLVSTKIWGKKDNHMLLFISGLDSFAQVQSIALN
ncbi:hypothetical protein MKW98_029002 [Papaver atlanticum]|uniref:Uncharacterized protein n=1 Tax=Papaver atlanticum TaxID=357466 RepID=A0AAD4TIZ2_9MAGN|nr:hypothetical protein MKW98_029002 [Papaver atlanticum]